MSTMIATHREALHKTKVTPEELLAMPDGGHYELIDGELGAEHEPAFEPGRREPGATTRRPL